MRPVFFLSDFGLEDPYAGEVRGVIARLAPGAPVHDLGHDLPPQNLKKAAWSLFAAVPWLPEGAVVLAVVDPGVGTERRALAVRGRRLFYVLPDNGLLTLAAERDPLEAAVALPLSETDSATFHGRDVFAPAAARLAAGAGLQELGTPLAVDELLRLPLGLGEEAGEVLTFDRFGNAITTVKNPARPPRAVRVGRHTLPFVRTFADVPPGKPLAFAGSSGLVEVAVNRGSARALLGLEGGEAVGLVF